MEWMNNKIDETEKWHFDLLDRQDALNMSKESKPPKKPTNEHNPIITPTPEKKKQEFEVMEDMEEDEDYALSQDYLDRL